MKDWKKCVWAALAALLFLGYGCSGFADEETLMARARANLEAGDHRAAIIELKNVLKASPRNAEARLLLGTAAYETGDTASAEKELRRAAEYGMPVAAYIELFGRSLIAEGMFADAAKVLDPEAITNDSLKATVHALRGQALLMLDNVADAEEQFDMALAIDPDSVDARLGIAGVHISRGDSELAEEVMASAVAEYPDSIRVHVSAARLQQQNNAFDKAAELFARAMSLAESQNARKQEQFNIATGLAEAQLAAGKSAEADATINKMLAMAPDSPASKFLKARAAFDATKFEESSDYLRQVLSVSPDFAPALTLMGASQLALGNLDVAEKHLQNAIGKQPNNLAARKMLAEVRMRQNRPDAALSALEPAASLHEDTQVMTMLAKASLRSGDQDAGLAYYKQGVANDPGNTQMQLGLASAYIAVGEHDKALEIVENLPETDQPSRTRGLVKVIALMRSGETDAAESEVERLLSEMPDNAEVANMAAGFYLAQQNDARAHTLLEQSLKLAPDNVAALVNLGRIDFRSGDLDSAYTRYQSFLGANPGNLSAMIAYSQLLEAGDRREEALQQMHDAMKANPNAVEPRTLLSRYYLSLGDADKARKLAQEGVRLGPNDFMAHISQGMVHMADRNLQEAHDSFRRATELSPRSATAHFNLARAQIALHRRNESRKTLNRVLELSPDHLRATVALTRLEMASGNLDRAAELADGFISANPDLGSPWILRGDVHMAAGQFAKAVESYMQAMKRAPTQSLAGKTYHARLKAGMANPEKPLLDWIADKPDDIGARMLLAQAYQRDNANDKAVQQYEDIVRRQPRNGIALNNLAWLYVARGDAASIESALDAAEQAHEILPDAGAITDTLGWLLLEHGDADRGLNLLRLAATQLPDNLDIRYHLAVALKRTGENNEARSILRDIVGRDGDFDSREDAEALLETL